MSHISAEMRHCINDCQNCHAVCLETTTHCLQEGGRHAEPGHVTLLLDCADICRTSADLMLRGSDFHDRTCGLCAEICDSCAASCESFGGYPTMQACAEACRRCAMSCRQMARPLAMAA